MTKICGMDERRGNPSLPKLTQLYRGFPFGTCSGIYRGGNRPTPLLNHIKDDKSKKNCSPRKSKTCIFVQFASHQGYARRFKVTLCNTNIGTTLLSTETESFLRDNMYSSLAFSSWFYHRSPFPGSWVQWATWSFHGRRRQSKVVRCATIGVRTSSLQTPCRPSATSRRSLAAITTPS